MNQIYVTLHFGPAEFKYTFLFMVYLAVGWLTVLFHAREKFDQPTYDIGNADPSSIMVPRLFLSQHLYFRGFIIYLTGMTGVYVALSLAGPALVMGVLAVFGNPDAASTTNAVTSETVVPGQWPLVLALSIVGLAPNIAGLRTPELLLRRFSHRIALIPAYARYLAFRMRQSPFDLSAHRACIYPATISYRPSRDSADAIDQQWQKILVLFAYVQASADGTTISDNGGPVDDNARSALQTEARLLCSTLRDIDAQLIRTPATERNDLEPELQEVLSRLYLLTACTMLASRIRDIDGEMREIGFQATLEEAPTLLPLAMALSLLFLVLLIANETLLSIGGSWGEAVAPPSFSLNCLSTFYTAITFGASLLAAIGVYRSWSERSAKHKSDLSRSLSLYFLAALFGYGAGWVVLTGVLFPILAPQGLDKLFAFSTFRALSPAAGAILLALWLQRDAVRKHEFVRYAAISATVLALVAGFGSFLLLPEVDESYPVLRVSYDAFQGLISGLAVAFLAEVGRSYQSNVLMATGRRDTSSQDSSKERMSHLNLGSATP
jgi:hypothetical protein